MDTYKSIQLSQLKAKFQVVVFFLICFLCNCLYAESTIKDNKGEFTFEYKNSIKTRNVKVHYYSPEKLAQNSRVVFVMHGDGRNGAVYRDEWLRYAEKNNFLVLCPELSEEDFPFWEYNCGNIYDDSNKKYNSKQDWTFNLIEQLFDFAREDRKMIVESYCIFGHSAGAQFVQKMVLFMPEARFSMAIANGAGWYTLPNFEEPFYTGLNGTPVTEEILKQAFEKNLIILMGEKDFVSPTKPASYTAATHKWDRVWRAKFFFEEAKTKSEQIKVKLNWFYKTVPGADHNDPRHAAFGSQLAATSKKSLRKSENLKQ